MKEVLRLINDRHVIHVVDIVDDMTISDSEKLIAIEAEQVEVTALRNAVTTYFT